MISKEEIKTLLDNSSFKVSNRLRIGMWAFLAIGVLSFVAGIFTGHADLAWQALLINTLFFTGVTHAGIMFSVIFTITDAKWGRPIKRFAEAMGSFIPVSWILFGVLFFGGHYFFEWMDHDKVIHTKEAWLNYSFFVKRNVVMILLTGVLSLYYVKVAMRVDIGLANSVLPNYLNPFATRIGGEYGDHEEEIASYKNKSRLLAPWLGFIYALMTSLIAFDWIMSIDQEWFSTMFGVQYLVSNIMGASAILMIVSGIARSKFKLEDYISIDRYHDNSKLTFAFSLLWTYMIFSQVIVIWYANLPEETPYMLLRMKTPEWAPVFWLIFVVLFLVPFWGLMSKTACRSIWFSRIIAVIVLVGIWLEKYFLVVPSLQENALSAGGGHGGGFTGLHINLLDIGIALGMIGAFILSYLWVLQRVPIVPIADEHFFKKAHH